MIGTLLVSMEDENFISMCCFAWLLKSKVIYQSRLSCIVNQNLSVVLFLLMFDECLTCELLSLKTWVDISYYISHDYSSSKKSFKRQIQTLNLRVYKNTSPHTRSNCKFAVKLDTGLSNVGISPYLVTSVKLQNSGRDTSFSLFLFKGKNLWLLDNNVKYLATRH